VQVTKKREDEKREAGKIGKAAPCGQINAGGEFFFLSG
jgi:hypothetical protein